MHTQEEEEEKEEEVNYFMRNADTSAR